MARKSAAGIAGSGGARAIVVDSFRGIRHLDTRRSVPSSLTPLRPDRTVLDWILHALSSCGLDHVTYVGGYHIEKVIQTHPGLDYRFQPNWQQEGEVAALALPLPFPPADYLIVRASTICVAEAVRRARQERGVTAGYYQRDEHPLFAGLVSLPAVTVDDALRVARSLMEREPTANLERWLEVLAAEGFEVQAVDVDSLAAPIHDPVAVARTVFGGKGRTLQQVAPLLKSAVVLDQVRFGAAEWVAGGDETLARIGRTFRGRDVIVRSSAHAEDGAVDSAAGRFETVLGVPADRPELVRAAVARVVASYRRDGRTPHPLDEVLVQPHLAELAASGVVLTRDLGTGAPYYVVSCDRASGRSDVVTSGAGFAIDTFYIARDNHVVWPDDQIRVCIELARELEAVTHMDGLNIEFGIDRKGTAYLFQVRPITAARTFELADDDLAEDLGQVREFLEAHFRPHPLLAGSTTIFGTMPDWNPAEMIGTTPHPLALSLYQRLIGERAWAVARALMGYRNVEHEPLIVSLGGRPYVDVRASLNSFLPDGLDAGTAAIWIDNCLRTLRDEPHLHDKLEFEVAVTCLTFDFDRHLPRLRAAGLGDAAIRDFRTRLLAITDAALIGRRVPIDGQLGLIEELGRRRRLLCESNATTRSLLACRIRTLLADCERLGVVPFAVLARYAFIAVDLLRSLRGAGVLSEEEVETVLRSVATVASELSLDAARLAAGELPTAAFLERYGHLRPGSYDITSPNYARAFETYLGRSRTGVAGPAAPGAAGSAVEVFDAHACEITDLLRARHFSASVVDLRDFICHAIAARERSKFEFMKSVDAILEDIAALGQTLGFSREEMSFVPIDMLLRGATDSASGAVQAEFRRQIEFNKKRWNLTCALRLPHLVRSPADVTIFRMEEWAPNFISSKRVIAPPVVIEDGVPEEPLAGKVVLIRAADPGYDWLFSHPIAGLVTTYGGVASHMAIRAAEFGLPAAIGCGELVFDRLRSARLVELDCTNRKVRALS